MTPPRWPSAPSGNRRLYRYEDPGFPFALTAIEVESPALKRRVTLSQWHYDAQGRVRQYEGWQGERMQFGYQSADAAGVLQTEVEDRQGRKQTYHGINGPFFQQSLTNGSFSIATEKNPVRKDDGHYNMVEFQEEMKYGRSSGVDFGPVDFVKYKGS